MPGYGGLVCVECDMPMALRVAMEAENIPASFPVQEAKSILDYDFTGIAGSPLVVGLPRGIARPARRISVP